MEVAYPTDLGYGGDRTWTRPPKSSARTTGPRPRIKQIYPGANSDKIYDRAQRKRANFQKDTVCMTREVEDR
jgi:hypothetical protein